MDLKVRRARLYDLERLILFAFEEAKEAEGIEKVPATLRIGIETALNDENIAIYWVLVDERDEPVGNVSALREWSNWNAGFYWWIQSMYISPEYRGKGYLSQLLDAVKAEAQTQGGLELRLYVHEDNKLAVKAYRKSGFLESKYKIMTQKL
jgi:ribosomal protein S18 acetylase RimI-like enzyme